MRAQEVKERGRRTKVMRDGRKADISIFLRRNQYFDCSGGRWQSDKQAEGM
jgi:hypothetical protein